MLHAAERERERELERAAAARMHDACPVSAAFPADAGAPGSLAQCSSALAAAASNDSSGTLPGPASRKMSANSVGYTHARTHPTDALLSSRSSLRVSSVPVTGGHPVRPPPGLTQRILRRSLMPRHPRP
jgi:hypothetical protein